MDSGECGGSVVVGLNRCSQSLICCRKEQSCLAPRRHVPDEIIFIEQNHMEAAYAHGPDNAWKRNICGDSNGVEG